MNSLNLSTVAEHAKYLSNPKEKALEWVEKATTEKQKNTRLKIAGLAIVILAVALFVIGLVATSYLFPLMTNNPLPSSLLDAVTAMLFPTPSTSALSIVSMLGAPLMLLRTVGQIGEGLGLMMSSSKKKESEGISQPSRSPYMMLTACGISMIWLSTFGGVNHMLSSGWFLASLYIFYKAGQAYDDFQDSSRSVKEINVERKPIQSHAQELRKEQSPELRLPLSQRGNSHEEPMRSSVVFQRIGPSIENNGGAKPPSVGEPNRHGQSERRREDDEKQFRSQEVRGRKKEEQAHFRFNQARSPSD
ncbi:MAG: hypothetical protein WAM28_05990 [Chlamydiales bacterium]